MKNPSVEERTFTLPKGLEIRFSFYYTQTESLRPRIIKGNNSVLNDYAPY